MFIIERNFLSFFVKLWWNFEIKLAMEVFVWVSEWRRLCVCNYGYDDDEDDESAQVHKNACDARWSDECVSANKNHKMRRTQKGGLANPF